MPQPPIHLYWKDRIKHHLGKGQRPLPATAIRHILKEEYAALDFDLQEEYRPAPSVRSIGRIRENEWVPLSVEEKVQYREFYFPESMERGELPWEASAACLELLGSDVELRPTVRLAQAFWRITLAAPDLDASTRQELARKWSVWQSLGSHAVPQELRNLELFLAIGPWKSEEAHAVAVQADEAGLFDMRVGLTIRASDIDESTLMEAYTEKFRSAGEAKDMIDWEKYQDLEFEGAEVTWQEERVPSSKVPKNETGFLSQNTRSCSTASFIFPNPWSAAICLGRQAPLV